MSISFPPIETTYQLLYAESELYHVERPFGGPVAANAVAVDDNESTLVDVARSFGRHGPMRNADSAGDMLMCEGLRRPRIDHGDRLARIESHLEVPGVDFVRELVRVVFELIGHIDPPLRAA